MSRLGSAISKGLQRYSGASFEIILHFESLHQSMAFLARLATKQEKLPSASVSDLTDFTKLVSWWDLGSAMNKTSQLQKLLAISLRFIIFFKRIIILFRQP